jgi:hypothetical protein
VQSGSRGMLMSRRDLPRAKSVYASPAALAQFRYRLPVHLFVTDYANG